MGHESTQTLARTRPGIRIDRRTLLQAGFFLLVWPTFNVLFISSVLLHLDHLDVKLLAPISFALFASFALAYALVLTATRLLPSVFAEERFWSQLVLHIAAIFVAVQVFGTGPTASEIAQVPRPPVVPLVFSLFQITLYVAVKTLILQRERHLATQLNLRQAQVNMLRSQSNPHFLFNTLNLLASEIGRDPGNAREIVYDLADLLRDSMRAAEREFITLGEEVRLLTLYLALQQKRFPERLAFAVDIEDRASAVRIPSLLLQPVVENVVKHVVAQSNALTEVRVTAHTSGNALLVTVQDNGKRIDTNAINAGGGLRIVRDTLALHYHGQAEMRFDSDDSGSSVTISLPMGGDNAVSHE